MRTIINPWEKRFLGNSFMACLIVRGNRETDRQFNSTYSFPLQYEIDLAVKSVGDLTLKANSTWF